MALPSELTARRSHRGSRLGEVILLLSSNSDGEVLNAARAMLRPLQSCGADIYALLEHVENGGELTNADKQRIRSEIECARAVGYAKGVKAAEAEQHGIGAFRNTDGKLEWTEVALFCQREKHRLATKHHEFVDDMASRTVWGREPPPRQHQYLHRLFHKLGGKIT
jgi:hypothetical protein